MNRHRTATILHLPLAGDRLALWAEVAAHLGVPHHANRIARRPWRWLNQHAAAMSAASVRH